MILNNSTNLDSIESNAPNIVLIGFMGCGKTSLARFLAQKTNSLWIDTDSQIQMLYNKSIKEIFALFGENEFRNIEKNLAISIADSIKGAVISCGGGLSCFCPLEIFKKMGTSFFINLDFEKICARLSEEELSTRPLFANKEVARNLFNSRLALYKNAADFEINGDDKIENLAEQILEIYTLKAKK